MNKRIVTALFLSSCVMLSACREKADESERYIDPTEASQQIQSMELNTIVKTVEGGFYDDKPVSLTNRDTTTDGRFMYSFIGEENFKIDLITGQISSFCRVPGCPHTKETYGCLNYCDFQCPVATEKGIYYTSENKVMFCDGEKTTCVFTNEFFTDNDKKIIPDHPDYIESIAIYKNELYMLGCTFCMSMNLENGEVSEPIVLDDKSVFGFCAVDGELYYTNLDYKFFYYKIAEGKREKLGDNIPYCRQYEEQIYYIQYEDGIPILYRFDHPDSPHEKVLDNCYVCFAITNGYIYYQHFSVSDIDRLNGESDFGFYMYDMKTGETKKADIEYTKYDVDGNVEIKFNQNKRFITAYSPMIDHVFVVDMQSSGKTLIVVFKAGEIDYKVIEKKL